MRVVGISGSPRRRATEFVLKEALKMLEERGIETEIFTVRGKRIEFCQHCDYCLKRRGCRIEDDMISLYRMLGAGWEVDARDFDGIIMATPVYNSGVSAQMKAVMDRCRALVAYDYDFFRGKVGIGVAVGGDRAGGQEIALLQITSFYVLNGVIPVSGGSFGANLGATFWSRDTLEGVKEDEEGFRSLRKTVKRFYDALVKYRR